jgi:hypothetical protein
MTANKYVRLYEPDLAEACDRFTRRVWPESGDAGGNALDSGTGTRPPRVLFLKDGEVIGHVATAPVRLAVRGRLRDASWAVGLVVLPEHRNGPVAPLLMRKLSEEVDIGLTLHVEKAALRIFQGVGWHYLGVIPQYARVLNMRAVVRMSARRESECVPRRWSRIWHVLAHAEGPVAALGSAFFAGLAVAGGGWCRGRTGVAVLEERAFDPSYTSLAERVKDKFAVWVFRDEKYLVSRYAPKMSAYRLLACREQDRLLGYCIVKIRQFEGDPRMGDIRMGTLVDCVFDPDELAVLDLLLRSAVALCRRERIDVVFCSASFRQMGRCLRRHAFVELPGTLNAAFHDRTRTMDEDLPLGSWHLMRGDSDADANC